MADLWSDYSDGIIKDLDNLIGAKYKITLRGLLTDPTKYASTPNIQMTIDNMKEEVEAFFDLRAKDLADEKKDFDDGKMRADAVTGQLSQNISMQAKQNNVPIIKPVMIDRDVDREERLYFDSFDNSVSALIGKLVSGAVLIADSTVDYGDYKVGEWVFGGVKDYVIQVYSPTNAYSILQDSRTELLGLLDSASTFIKGL